jgi:hypothetical protein
MHHPVTTLRLCRIISVFHITSATIYARGTDIRINPNGSIMRTVLRCAMTKSIERVRAEVVFS